MRKGFTFYQSYYQVVNDLDNDSDKLEFLMSLLSRQFEGIQPTNLSKMVSFAYNSQRHSIDKQVEGYENKTGKKLRPYQDPYEGGSEGPTEGGKEDPYHPPSYGVVMTTEGPSEGPSLQEQEKGKEKGKEQQQAQQQVFSTIEEILKHEHLVKEYIKSE